MHISYIFYVLDGLKLHILSPRCTVHGRSREPRPSVTNIECHAFFLSKCMFVGGKHMTVLYAKTRIIRTICDLGAEADSSLRAFKRSVFGVGLVVMTQMDCFSVKKIKP